MNTATVIRCARAEDAERLVQLHFDAVHVGAKDDYPPQVLDAWSPKPNRDRYAWMRREIESGQNQVRVMEARDGNLAGFCMFSPATGFIQAVYVAPDYFGMAVGRSLLRNAEASILEAGTREASLNASSNALGFYRSEGYVWLRSSTQGLADGSRMDCHEMAKALFNSSN